MPVLLSRKLAFMNYGDRLAAAIKDAGVSRKALAEALGVSVQAIGDVLSGKTKAFNAANNARAAQFLKIDEYALAVGDPRPAPRLSLVKETDDQSVIRIPQFETGGSMGKGLILPDQPGVIKNLEVSDVWAKKNLPANTGYHNLCIVTGFGDSMKGLYNSGDPLIVDRGVTKVDIDAVFFFRIGDEGFIKRLQRIPGEGIRVISANKEYESWTIKPGMDLDVFGRVLLVWKSEIL